MGSQSMDQVHAHLSRSECHGQWLETRSLQVLGKLEFDENLPILPPNQPFIKTVQLPYKRSRILLDLCAR